LIHTEDDGASDVREINRGELLGFTFGDDKLSKPGKCPECRGTLFYEPQIRIA
jgi:predicted Zn-ribbon and HTH transcriptional regulator